MAKYSYITDKTHNNRKIQVESAKRDGSGKNIENNYAKQNGNYQSLTAGLSNNFDTKLVMVDESAYNFRPTASMGSTELEVGSPCKVKKIVGGSVAFNQLAKEFNSTNWATLSATATYNNGVAMVVYSSGGRFRQTMATEKDHKYLYSITAKSGDSCVCVVELSRGWLGSSFNLTADTKTKIEKIITPTSATDGSNLLQIYPTTETTIELSNFNFIDLTQMFGSTIADYIYSLEQANEGSGVAWFKRYFPKKYYAYNSGELVSIKTQGKKITHFNQWDEEWEIVYGSNLASKNHIKIMPNTTYYFRITSLGVNTITINYYDEVKNNLSNTYITGGNVTFTTPTNAVYMKFVLTSAYGTTYKHDICINFHYDGERDGEYEPYNSETYPCDDVELRGIPQLDENNNLVFGGDEYGNDGTRNVRYGSYTFTGNEVWSASGSAYQANITGLSNIVKKASANTDVFSWQINTAGLKATSGGELYLGNDTSGIAVITNGNIFIGSDDYANISNLVGKTIVFELTTPTDENSIPFTEVQECDNWGTEEWLAPTTDTRPCEVPVGHETDYLPDLKAKLEVAPTTPNENGVYVMEHSASGNSYTPIATWLANNGYKTEETMKDTFGMKDALGGTLRHLLITNIVASGRSLDFTKTDYVDMGTLNWYYASDDQGFFALLSSMVSSQTEYDFCLCTMYKSVKKNSVASLLDMEIATDNSRYVIVKDTRYTDATTFKNAMKGVLLAYEKASQ